MCRIDFLEEDLVMRNYEIPLTARAALSPREFAAACGRHASWAYRLLYAGKIKALTGVGRILIPASELHRLLQTADQYNPRPNGNQNGG
jgi:hypothetical protein